MSALRLDRLLDFFSGPHLIWGLLWLGLVFVTLGLVALMVTRWGQSQPLGKCMVLSLLTHLLLATYATTVQIVTVPPAGEPFTTVKIGAVELPSAEGAGPQQGKQLGGERSKKPWDHFAAQAAAKPATTPLDRREQARPAVERAQLDEPPLPADAPLEALPDSEARRPEARPLADDERRETPSGLMSPEAIAAPRATRRDVADPALAERSDLERAPDKAAPTPLKRPPNHAATLPSALTEAATLPRMSERAVAPAAPSPPSLVGPARVPRTSSPLAPEGEPLVPVAGGTGAVGGGLGDRGADVQSAVGRGARGMGRGGDPDGLPVDAGGVATLRLTPRRPGEGAGGLPEIYSRRRAPQRGAIVESAGGSPETEAAVKAALRWLAAHQHPDGRWDASDHGAGRELKVGGQDRKAAGKEADTGVTGLALLAFLGNGQTHLAGDYRQAVDRGLQFLIRSQNRRDGNLGGNAEHYARMYCHGMAALALSEAYAMTGDERLLEPVERAIAYTVAAQIRSTGGWRYQAGDASGDTSQLGWQLMALKSAHLAGIEVPDEAFQGSLKFLRSVASGAAGGRASYRRGEAVTAPMTAEALVCRQFLGVATNPATNEEAARYLLRQPPSPAKMNLYYWYYGTLAMFQLQGDPWRQWNLALKDSLLATQHESGSWDPGLDVWGGHGGRVYTTALGALCLEVYYRYLPLYVQSGPEPERAK